MKPAITYLDLASFEKDVFPFQFCTIQNKRESNVFDSKVVYLCIITDDRFEDTFRGVLARPYIAKGDDGKEYYGWVDLSGNIIDHAFRSIHGDHEKVIAWKLI